MHVQSAEVGEVVRVGPKDMKCDGIGFYLRSLVCALSDGLHFFDVWRPPSGHWSDHFFQVQEFFSLPFPVEHVVPSAFSIGMRGAVVQVGDLLLTCEPHVSQSGGSLSWDRILYEHVEEPIPQYGPRVLSDYILRGDKHKPQLILRRLQDVLTRSQEGTGQRSTVSCVVPPLSLRDLVGCPQADSSDKLVLFSVQILAEALAASHVDELERDEQVYLLAMVDMMSRVQNNPHQLDQFATRFLVRVFTALRSVAGG